jgi:predicted transcriptional regulator
MSYGQLSRYLDEMVEMGFVESKTKPYRAYVSTPKGKQFNEMLGLKKEDVDSIKIEQFR